MKTDNELIAEFMKSDAVNSPHLRTAKDLEDTYDYSWDWLMPVVVEIRRKMSSSEGHARFAMVLADLQTLSITETHKTVVGFIRWYSTHSTETK